MVSRLTLSHSTGEVGTAPITAKLTDPDPMAWSGRSGMCAEVGPLALLLPRGTSSYLQCPRLLMAAFTKCYDDPVYTGRNETALTRSRHP